MTIHYVENIIQHQNLSSLILNNITLDKLETINQLFDNLNLHKINLLYCNFNLGKTKIQIKLVDGKITLCLSHINFTLIKPFLINLPQCIESIYIKQSMFDLIYSNYIPNNLFVNLPSSYKI